MTTVVLLSGGVPWVGSVGVATAVPTTVSGCTTIDTPGTYELADDVADSGAKTCVRVTSSDVYFDGGGHIVAGLGNDQTRGIHVSSAVSGVLQNVTVTNVAIRNWDTPVEFTNVTDASVTDTAIRDTGPIAIGYNGSSGTLARNTVIGGTVRVDDNGREVSSTVSSNDVTGSTVGLVVSDAGGSQIVGNTISDNQFDGIRTTSNTTIFANTITNNGANGVSGVREENLTIEGNTVANNGAYGVLLGRTNDSLVSANFFQSNAAGGIILRPQGSYAGEPGYSSHNEIRNNSFLGPVEGERPGSDASHTAAIRLELATDNVVADNAMTGYAAGVEFFKPQDATPEGTDPVGLNTDNVVTRNEIEFNGVGVYVNEWFSDKDEYYTVGNTIYDNSLNNSVNAQVNDAAGEFGTARLNSWNVVERPGTNIVGGPNIGGNYWANPAGTGHSQTCGDSDGDGICDTTSFFGTDPDPRDVAGNNTDILPLAAPSLRGNSSPQAGYSVTPDAPVVYEEVTFDGTDSTDDGPIVSYEWDFDDDGTFDATGGTVTHTFASTGNYPVTLRVTDDEGITGEFRADITVGEASVAAGIAVDEAQQTCVAPGERVAAVLSVTDLEHLQVTAETVGALAVTDLLVDGKPAAFGENVTYLNGRTGTVSVSVRTTEPATGTVSLNYTDGLSDQVLARSGPTSVHNETIVVPQDSKTIQGAIDVACDGATIEVEDGTYEETLSIEQGDNLTIRNAPDSTPTLAPAAEARAPAVNLTTGGTLTFDGIDIDLTESNRRGVLTNRATSSNLRVHNTTITGAASAFQLDASGTAVLRDIDIRDSYRGIDGGAIAGPLRLTLDDVSMTDLTTFAIRFADGDVPDTVVAQDVRIDGGSSVGLYGPKQTRLTFDGLSVNGTNKRILVSGPSVALSNSEVTNVTGTGIKVLTGNLSLSDVTFSNIRTAAVNHSSDGSLTVRNVSVRDAQSGVLVSDGSGADIADSRFDRIGRTAVTVTEGGRASRLNLTETTIQSAGLVSTRGNQYAAVEVGEGVEVRILDTRIYDAAWNGIVLGGDGVIRGNEIRRVGAIYREYQTGIDVPRYEVTPRRSLVIEDNVVTGNASTSIDVDLARAEGSALVHNNTLEAEEIGLSFSGDGDITDNTIDDVARTGMSLNLPGGSVTGNVVDARTNGISLYMTRNSGSDSVRIADNVVRNVRTAIHAGNATTPNDYISRGGPEYRGFWINAEQSDTVTFTNNTVVEAGNGVFVSGGVVTMTDNEVRDVTGIGLHASCGVRSAVAGVTGNTVENATIGLALPADALEAGATVQENALVETETQVYNCGNTTLDASSNYFGPDGPTNTSGSVNTNPFFTADPSTVDRDPAELQSFGYSVTMEPGRTYAFGTPAPLAGDLATTFGDFEGAVYLYDQSTDAWMLATGAESLGAMEAAVVVPESRATAVIDFADSTPARPTVRELSPGWNFVAPRDFTSAEDGFSTRTVAATDLLSLYDEPAGLPGGLAGDVFTAYTFDTETTVAGGPTVTPFGGYFVYVTEDGTIPGRVPSGVTLGEFQSYLEAAEDEHTGSDDAASVEPTILVGAPDAGSVYLDDGAGRVSGFEASESYPDADAADTVMTANPGQRAGVGSSMAFVGDVNGDGYEDVLVGAAGDGLEGSNAGTAYLLYGPVSDEVDLTSADVQFLAENAGDSVGSSVAGAGDLDGDGLADLLIGAPSASVTTGSRGAVYVVYGSSIEQHTSPEGMFDLADADVSLTGGGVGSSTGSAVAGGGDFDGDGIPDIAVADPQYSPEDVPKLDIGRVVVISSGSLRPGTLSLDQVGYTISGNESWDELGSAVAFGTVGDTAADSILIGADRPADTAGQVYVVDASEASPGGRDNVVDAAQLTIEGSAPAFGTSLATGEVDGDQRDDVLVGSPNGGFETNGRAYLLTGSDISHAVNQSALGLSDSVTDVSTLTSTTFVGANVSRTGADVAFSRHANARADSAVIGAPKTTTGTRWQTGAVYVVTPGEYRVGDSVSRVHLGATDAIYGTETYGDFGTVVAARQVD